MKEHIFVTTVCAVVSLAMFCPAFAQSPKEADAPRLKSLVDEQKMAPLISVPALVQKIKSGDDICLIEIGEKRKRYDQEHIKDAHFLHWVNDIINRQNRDRYNVLSKDSIEALLSKLGVTNDSHIIVYDRFSSRLSTRMYWTLKYWGHDKVQVLDGGFEKWASSQSVTDAVPEQESSNYKVATVRHELRVDAKQVQALVSSSNGTLIDGRPEKQFTGEKPGAVFHTGKLHMKKGHIPGAVNIPWKDNLKADGTFKSVLELRQMYHQNGMDSQGPIVTYCNEGLHAALPWFVASAILKCENVSMYDDSMAEWANSDRPVQTKVPEPKK